jgi:hypothetical protein
MACLTNHQWIFSNGKETKSHCSWSEATNENHIGLNLVSHLLFASTIVCAGIFNPSEGAALFCCMPCSRLDFTETEGHEVELDSSPLTFDLSPCSLTLVLSDWAFSWASSFFIWTRISCSSDLLDFVLLEPSTEQFKGFQKSAFPLHGLTPSSETLLGLCCLGDSAVEEFYTMKIITQEITTHQRKGTSFSKDPKQKGEKSFSKKTWSLTTSTCLLVCAILLKVSGELKLS